MTIKKNRLALLVGLACASGASAQEAYTFDEVVVSATRSEQNISDVAASVDLVDSKKMENNLAQDLEQAVVNEPGVSMPGTGRYGNSGFNIRGLSENYVKTLVDGVEQPASYDPGERVMRKFNNTVETDTLQRIEINKGPSSSLYGSDALAGTVVIRTKNPEDLLVKEGNDTYASVKSGYYSADESYKATVTLANRFNDLETLFIYTRRDGHEMSTHSSGADILGRDRGQADPFDFTSDNILAKAFYQLTDEHKIGVTAEVFQRDASGLILSEEGHTIMPGYTYTRNSGDDEDKRQRFTLEHNWQANLALFDQLNWQVSNIVSKSNHDTYDHTDANGYRNRSRNGEDKSTQFEVQFDKAFELGNSYHELSYGSSIVSNEFNLAYQDILFDRDIVKPGKVEVPNAKSVKWGIFIQDQAFFMDERLIINTGIRYDDFTAKPSDTSTHPKSESHAVTGKLGAVYHWTTSVNTYANISQGFKSPTLQDLYYFYETNAAFGAIYEPNPNLKPEESVGYEAGIRFTNEFAQINFATFYNDYNNFIESKKLPDSNGKEVWTKENISKASIYGAEMKVKVNLDSFSDVLIGWYSQFNLAYAKGEDKQNNEAIDSVAPLTSYLAMGYANQDDTLGGKISIKAVAGKSGSDWSNANDIDNAKAPGYAVTDITAYYRPMKQMTVRAGLFNLFDKKYWDYNDLIQTPEDKQGLDRRTQTGRNWGLEAEYVF